MIGWSSSVTSGRRRRSRGAIAVAEDADAVDAVAVPIAGDRCRRPVAVVEHVVDQVARELAGGCARLRRAVADGASSGCGGTFFGGRPLDALVVRIGQARLVLNRPGSPGHAGPKMPMSSLPSPSQSPVTGRSSSVPSLAHRSSSSHWPLPLRSRNHSPLIEDADLVMPSPLKSPSHAESRRLGRTIGRGRSDFTVARRAASIAPWSDRRRSQWLRSTMLTNVKLGVARPASAARRSRRRSRSSATCSRSADVPSHISSAYRRCDERQVGERQRRQCRAMNTVGGKIGRRRSSGGGERCRARCTSLKLFSIDAIPSGTLIRDEVVPRCHSKFA